jgi:hypothetical protein
MHIEALPFFMAAGLLLFAAVNIRPIESSMKEAGLPLVNRRTLSWLIDVSQFTAIVLLPALGLAVLWENLAAWILGLPRLSASMDRNVYLMSGR